jgi:hypothetical protein
LTRPLKVELLHVPDCPHAEQARQLLLSCIGDLGLANVTVEDREGDYPSPSIIVNGTDVMGAPPDAAASCRLDLPTRDRVMSALQRACVRRHAE